MGSNFDISSWFCYTLCYFITLKPSSNILMWNYPSKTSIQYTKTGIFVFNITSIRYTEKSQFTTNNININNDKIYIITTLEHAMGNILEVEAWYNTFKKESELKRLRIVNKSVFGRLLQSTLIWL
jgi:hypothetical protein